jgi:hypothetical protein
MGTPAMFAVKTIIISVAARLASTSNMMSGETLGLDGAQKNQLIVAVLNAIDSYARSKNQSVLKAVLSGVSIDLIGQEVLKLTKMEDKTLIGGA